MKKSQWLKYMLQKKAAKGDRKFRFFLNYLESEVPFIDAGTMSTSTSF